MRWCARDGVCVCHPYFRQTFLVIYCNFFPSPLPSLLIIPTCDAESQHKTGDGALFHKDVGWRGKALERSGLRERGNFANSAQETHLRRRGRRRRRLPPPTSFPLSSSPPPSSLGISYKEVEEGRRRKIQSAALGGGRAERGDVGGACGQWWRKGEKEGRVFQFGAPYSECMSRAGLWRTRIPGGVGPVFVPHTFQNSGFPDTGCVIKDWHAFQCTLRICMSVFTRDILCLMVRATSQKRVHRECLRQKREGLFPIYFFLNGKLMLVFFIPFVRGQSSAPGSRTRRTSVWRSCRRRRSWGCRPQPQSPWTQPAFPAIANINITTTGKSWCAFKKLYFNSYMSTNLGWLPMPRHKKQIFSATFFVCNVVDIQFCPLFP